MSNCWLFRLINLLSILRQRRTMQTHAHSHNEQTLIIIVYVKFSIAHTRTYINIQLKLFLYIVNHSFRFTHTHTHSLTQNQNPKSRNAIRSDLNLYFDAQRKIYATYVWKIRIYRISRFFTCMNTWNGIWCGCALNASRRTELNWTVPNQNSNGDDDVDGNNNNNTRLLIQPQTPVRTKTTTAKCNEMTVSFTFIGGHEYIGIGLKMDQNDVIPFDNHVECSLFMYNKCYRNHPRWNAISFWRGPFSIHLQWARRNSFVFSLAISYVLFCCCYRQHYCLHQQMMIRCVCALVCA